MARKRGEGGERGEKKEIRPSLQKKTNLGDSATIKRMLDDAAIKVRRDAFALWGHAPQSCRLTRDL